MKALLLLTLLALRLERDQVPAFSLTDHLLGSISAEQALAYQQRVHYDWRRWARPQQLTPGGTWDIFGIVAGRGGGKTRAGAEATNEFARENPGARIALAARTAADCRDTIVLGESGLLSTSPPWFRPRYVPSKRLVLWPNGAEGHLYSAEKPDSARGPQHHFLWGDEFAAWKRVRDEKGGDLWSNLQDGLRLGKNPRAVLTTTPRPTDQVFDTFLGLRDAKGRRPIGKSQIDSGRWELVTTTEDHLGRPVRHRAVVVRFRTEENAINLAPGFVAKRRLKYAGTQLGEQELDAAFLAANENALWLQETIDLHRVDAVDCDIERTVVAIDPSRSESLVRDECGIIVAQRGKNGHVYIVEDGSLSASPFDWAHRALSLARKYRADAILFEDNRLDERVKSTMQVVASTGAFKWERWTSVSDKKARAEPVSALYRAGRVHHVNPIRKSSAGEREWETHEFLEHEMVTWDPSSRVSPNRMDAMVLAVTDLALGKPRSVLVGPTVVGSGAGSAAPGWRR